MKKCPHCGHENPDGVILCQKCGTVFQIQFTTPGPTDKKAPPVQKHWLPRILIAICIWVIISAISIHVAWHQSQHSIAWFRQLETQEKLTVISNSISAYQRQFHAAPTNIDQLMKWTNSGNDVSFWSSDNFIDGWGHPLIITNGGSTSIVISYGRDGKPGGVGIDYDLTSANPRPKEALATFDQFWANTNCQGMINTSIFCGGLAAILSFSTVKVPSFKPKGIIILVLSLCATTFAALWVTVIITLVHIPNGH